MTFAELLDQALALLQRHGRVTYQTFQLQYQLDEVHLAALKDQLLYAYPQVIDDEGRGLVWTAEWSAPEPEAQPEREVEMRFHALLPAVIGLLRGERWVTYRALKYVFSIDDTLLREIREELTFRRLAIDENGTGLVWTWEVPPVAPPAADVPHPPAITDTKAGDSSPAVPPLPPPVTETPTPSNGRTVPTESIFTEALQGESAVTPEPVRSPPKAERRQLTVVFCDLADSTQLSQQLDPEDLREVVRAYQETAAEVIQHYEGHIAQYLGDGLLIYFGFPIAHEDDAQRAAYTALGILDAMGTLNTRLEADYSVKLAVRLGIHTGPVVVGEMGGGGRYENLATGETVNIAARLEGLAAPNTAMLSQGTVRLVRDAFALEDLGMQTLKGIAEPMGVFRVRVPVEAHYDDKETPATSVPFLMGRDEEIGLLHRRWEQTKEGRGQVVLLSGEAGIGKSALVEELRAYVRAAGGSRIAFRCSPYYQNSALYPMITHVEHLLRWQRDDIPATKLDKLERGLQGYGLPLEEVVPLLAALLSVPLQRRYPALTLPPEQQKQQTLDALVAWLVAEAERQPVLVAWEDLHWADPSTLEALGLLVDQAPTVPMLHVLTFRPAFSPPWPNRSHMTPITLTRLERPQVEALIARLSRGKALPADVVTHIVARTDGVPLYVEELTKMLLASELLQEEADHYTLTGPLTAVAIPATLQDSLMARLDQLNTAKGVAQLGAVLGREFPYAMLQAISPQDEETLQAGLRHLVAAELLYQRGRPPRAKYSFKHALIQDAAYASLLKGTRQQLHQQVAELLTTRFPEVVETQPEVVAYHYTEASCPEQAITHWQQAGVRALGHSAYREAVGCFEQALDVWQHLPETRETREQAIDLVFGLRNALHPLGEHGRILDHLHTAKRLAETLDDRRRLGWISVYMSNYSWWMGDQEHAIESGQRALAINESLGDFTLQVQTNFRLGQAFFALGDYRQAISFLTRNVDLLTGDLLHERFGLAGLASVLSRYSLACALAEQGAFAEAMTCGEEGIRVAEAANHPFSLVLAYFGIGLSALRQGVFHKAIPMLERGLTLCQNRDIPVFFAWLASALGYARGLVGQVTEALPLLEQAVEHVISLRIRFSYALWVAWLSEIYLLAGRPEEAQGHAMHALELSRAYKEHGNEAWVLRLLAEIAAHRHPPHGEPAILSYRQALTLADELGMRPLQAHCHYGLGRLYSQMGQMEQARTELYVTIEMYRAMEMAFWLTKSEVALAEVDERS